MPNTGNTFVYNYMAACNNCRGCLTRPKLLSKIASFGQHIADHFKRSSTINRLNSFCCWALTRLSKISDLTDILRTMIRLVGRHLCCVLSSECRPQKEDSSAVHFLVPSVRSLSPNTPFQLSLHFSLQIVSNSFDQSLSFCQ
jgi:hypothetical protein